ncbi:hypothetical protein HDU87_003163 [Geranomyces variabilis]|uniref:Uncharacterized protein n=1 Tax=Geranomyces variabilis TaxID=109894 RepID=A0AAD5TAM4_9FUNG|nr:hypothetical protein HDU87_003163 [Geranomyces variabilis]
MPKGPRIRFNTKAMVQEYRLFKTYGYDIDDKTKIAYPFNRFYTYLGEKDGVARDCIPPNTRRAYMYTSQTEPWLNRRHKDKHDLKIKEIEAVYEIHDRLGGYVYSRPDGTSDPGGYVGTSDATPASSDASASASHPRAVPASSDETATPPAKVQDANSLSSAC